MPKKPDNPASPEFQIRVEAMTFEDEMKAIPPNTPLGAAMKMALMFLVSEKQLTSNKVKASGFTAAAANAFIVEMLRKSNVNDPMLNQFQPITNRALEILANHDVIHCEGDLFHVTHKPNANPADAPKVFKVHVSPPAGRDGHMHEPHASDRNEVEKLLRLMLWEKSNRGQHLTVSLPEVITHYTKDLQAMGLFRDDQMAKGSFAEKSQAVLDEWVKTKKAKKHGKEYTIVDSSLATPPRMEGDAMMANVKATLKQHPEIRPVDKVEIVMDQPPQVEYHPTVDGELPIVEMAFNEGRYADALHHVALALQADPTHQATLAFMDRIIDAAPNAADLIPVQQGTNFGDAAAKAYILLKQGEFATALGILFNVAQVRPDVPYLTWVLPYLDQPAVFEKISREMMLLWAIPLQKYPALGPGREKLATLWMNVAQLFTAFRSAKGDADDDIENFYALVLRNENQLQEALDIAHAGLERSGNVKFCISLGKTYHWMKNFPESVKYYQQAIDLTPDNVDLYIDIADVYLDARDPRSSLQNYEKALEMKPQEEWAYPSALSLRYVLDHDADSLDQLRQYTASNPANRRAAELLARITR